ncbi:MAG: hypothetical protein ACLFSQ_07725 [Candidatus Zixiibacteriota bacterium]
MTIVETIREEVKSLSQEELAEFRRWFAEFDAELWDRQLEKDATDGKLDDLAKEAIREYRSGKAKLL